MSIISIIILFVMVFKVTFFIDLLGYFLIRLY